ncbi:unnamed protein product [Closterium sp. NIES-54]
MLLALRGDPDALDILTPRTYDEALSEPWASQWIAAMDPKMASWRSTGTYVNKVPPVVENVIDGMWVFKVKRPPGAQPAFKVRFIQQERVDFFLAFSPIPKMTTLRALLHIAAQRDYRLYSKDFSNALLQGSLHKQIWLHRPPGRSLLRPIGAFDVQSMALYDAIVTRYSSPATAALGRLILPYLFPQLSAFATVDDLVSHLRTGDARYRATVPAEFLARNSTPVFITLHFIVTCLPDSLRSVRDHFLSLDPTSLTVDLLEEHLLAAETSAVAVGAARGTPRMPFFEGCSPSPGSGGVGGGGRGSGGSGGGRTGARRQGSGGGQRQQQQRRSET